MIPTTPFGSLDVVVEVRAAEAAARAARGVPGIVRLQPGVVGLVLQFLRETWERATGKALPDIAGVQADLERGPDGVVSGVALDVRLVVRLGHPVGEVATAVQRAVGAAVVAEIELPVTQVDVHVVEIDVYAGARDFGATG